MRKLHVLQGGIENGDKKWIESAAKKGTQASSWVSPKSVSVGDDVVIYVVGHGFYATGRITSEAKPRTDWKNRYGAGIGSINLIAPAISLKMLIRKIPEFQWAKYPRSITTAPDQVGNRIREVIRERRQDGVVDLDESALEVMSLDELRHVALLKSKPSLPAKMRKAIYYARSGAIRRYVLGRAKGICEACEIVGPFTTIGGSPYLEPHHITRVADEGPDHPDKVIALCPNCHRHAHFAIDKELFNLKLQKKLNAIERKYLRNRLRGNQF